MRRNNMQTDSFVLDDLKMLLEKEEKWCVSVYMPTNRVSTRVQEDQIRFKNLTKEAEEKLAGLSNGNVDLFMEPAHKLLEDWPFWQYQSDGLSLFVASDIFRPYRLPLQFKELVVVTDRFHIKPLIPMLTGDGSFYVLALSQNQVRLLQCTKHSVREMSLEGVPTSLDEALKYDEPEKQLQFHTGTAGTGERPALFHGHGVGSDDAKDRLLRFFQLLDKGLSKLIPDERRPMVVAGVDYLAPIFQNATTHKHVFPETIQGNPEAMRPEELHQEGWKIVEPHFKKELQDRVETYQELSGTGKTSFEINDIVKESHNARVDTLFVTLGVQYWGAYNKTLSEVSVLEAGQVGAMDLLDFAAAQTILNGGTVYALEPEEMPQKALAAAILRY